MAITIGTQLNSLEVAALLGKGGMGEVYRARDTKLKRDVAIKVLPPEFSCDPDRLTRLQREAEVLASLNHPNIAAIYDLAEFEGSRFLVLEFVDGETLAELITRGPIPVHEALSIARNICEALEAAHDKGITHRDLKPANIKLTPDGKVKVLDFGLAKTVENAATNSSLSHSPTMLTAASNVGMILGTAAYMSPEQARGRQVDRRTDIFAFGSVLYEMLTGRPAFEGEDVTEILGRVVTLEPDWSRLPTRTPWLIQRLLRRALTKDARQRLGDIRDARIEIEDVLAGTTAPRLPAASSSRKREWLPWTIAVASFAALTAVSILYFNRATPPEIRVELNTPPTADPLSFAVSPDGRRLVFSALNERKSQLWVRPLDSVTAQPLAGTDGAKYPFWSPDSASVGFFADGKLKRIDIGGGSLQVLADANQGRGGTWNRDGTILFAPSPSRLMTVPSRSGEAVAITQAENRLTNYRFPQFLPDGRRFIYFVQSGTTQGVYAGSLDGNLTKRLANADSTAVVSPSSYLFFLQQSTLFAQPFDVNALELSGEPFPLASEVAFDPITFVGAFSVASNIIAYRTGSAGSARQLTWFDRSGNKVGTIGAPDINQLTNPELSPDGKRVAVTRAFKAGQQDIWLLDVERGVPTPLTFDPAADINHVWSPDGNVVAFVSDRTGIFNVYRKSLTGPGSQDLLSEQAPGPLSDWSPDGRFLLLRAGGA